MAESVASSSRSRPHVAAPRRRAVDLWSVVVSNSRRFGAYFFLSAVLLILAFLLYTQIFVVRPARRVARQMIEFYAFSYKLATQDTIVVADSGPDLTTIFEMIKDSEFPVVITDMEGIPQYWKGIDVSPNDPTEETIQRVRSTVGRLNLQNPPLRMTIPYIGDRILHYGDSALVSRLYWLPWLALAATGLFIGVGYAGFRHIKNSEQRALWVGMAVCIPTYMLAASLMMSGLTWWQAVLAVFLGNLIIYIPLALNGHAGAKYGIPFPRKLHS